MLVLIISGERTTNKPAKVNSKLSTVMLATVPVCYPDYTFILSDHCLLAEY